MSTIYPTNVSDYVEITDKLVLRGNTRLGTIEPLNSDTFIVDQVTATTLTDGVAVWTNGEITNLSSASGLLSPINPSDAVNKEYVDQFTGTSYLLSATVTTTNNITLSNIQTIDGILLSVGNRILVKDQTNKVENGLYIVSVGPWSRSLDLPIGSIASNKAVWISSGTINSDTSWVCINTVDQSTVGTDPLTYERYNITDIGAGDGLEKIGNTLNVITDNSSLEIDGSNNVSVKDLGINTSKFQNGSVTNDKLVNSDITILPGIGILSSPVSGNIQLGQTLNLEIDESDILFTNSDTQSKTGALSITNTTSISNTANPGTETAALNITGDILMNKSDNKIFFKTNSSGPPTLTNRSNGTKIVLGPNISSTKLDHAIGLDNTINSDTWFSVPDNNSSFKWYSASSEVQSLESAGPGLGGSLTNTSTISISSTANTVNATTFNSTTSSFSTANVSNELLLEDPIGFLTSSIKSPDSLSTSYSLIFPDDDGLAGQILKTDGLGQLSWVYAVDTISGSDTEVQFNNSGTDFGSDSDFTYDYTNNNMNVTGTIYLRISTGFGVVNISPFSTLSSDYRLNFPVSASGSPDQVLITDGSNPAELTWSSFVTSSSGSINEIQYNSDGSNFGASSAFKYDSSTDTLTIDDSGSNSGQISLDTNSTGFFQTITVPDALSSDYTLQLPTSLGSINQFLSTDGLNPATLSFINILETAPGSDYDILFNNGGSYDADSNLQFNHDENNILILGSSSTKGTLSLDTQISGFTASISSPSISSDYTIRLPQYEGLAGQLLSTDGNNPATLTWVDKTPGNSDEILFNDNGNIGSDTDFKYDLSNTNLIVPNITHTDLSPVSNTETVQYESVSSWTTSSTESNSWNSVTWSQDLSLFCAVSSSGSGNRIMTSSDGITWSTQISPEDNSWNSVTWSPELSLFCSSSSSGSGNRIMTSSDGISWSTQVSAEDNSWNSVTWSPELGLLCAVSSSGSGNRVMTSPDGVNWSTQVSADDNSWNSVTWSPELLLFCAVSSSGSGNRVMTSTNGITWITRTNPIDNSWNSVTWSPELSLFCSSSVDGTGNRIMTSSDGISWVTQVSAEDNSWNSVTWSPELGLLCAISDSSNAMVSSDGVNWSTVSTLSNNWTSIVWSPEIAKFCTVSDDGTNRAMLSNTVYSFETSLLQGTRGTGPSTSTEGTTKIEGYNIDIGRGSSNIILGQYSKEVNIGSTGKTPSENDSLSNNQSGSSTITKIDGDIKIGSEYLSIVQDYAGLDNWETQTFTDISSRAVVWSPELEIFCAIGLSGSFCSTSPDGRVWTTRTFTNINALDLTWSSELSLFCAVGTEPGGPYCSTSPDGITWTTRTFPNISPLSVTWSPQLSLFCSVGVVSDGCATSSDGITWTTRTFTDIDARSITWSPELNLFCAVGSVSPYCNTSSDGVNWTTRTFANIAAEAITWSPELSIFCAVGDGSVPQCSTSSDGINWTTRTFTDMNAQYIVWSSELCIFCVVGTDNSNINPCQTSIDGINWVSRTFTDINAQGLAWSPKLGIFCSTGQLSPFCQVTIPDYSSFNKQLTIGTRGSTNKTIIEGNEIDIGTGSNDVTIGKYSNDIKIGSAETIVNINSRVNISRDISTGSLLLNNKGSVSTTTIGDVSLNSRSGIITFTAPGGTPSADSTTTFTLSNYFIKSTSIIIVNIHKFTGFGSGEYPTVWVFNVSDESVDIAVANSNSASSGITSELQISFVVI